MPVSTDNKWRWNGTFVVDTIWICNFKNGMGIIDQFLDRFADINNALIHQAIKDSLE